VTQPAFVPVAETDQVRPVRALSVPEGWHANRVAEQRYPVRPGGAQLGRPGPDQGYALSLAKRFEERLVLSPDEHKEDVLVGCALLAARRASIFGRGPSIFDLEAALTCWGALGGAPAGLVAQRRKLFRSAAHHYEVQRELVDAVPEAILRLSAKEIADHIASQGFESIIGGEELADH